MSSMRRTQLVDLGHCPCAGATLDKLVQPAVLAVLADGPLHGYALVQRLATMPVLGGREPDAAGVYRTLRSLASRGLVDSSWDVSGTGPAKRLYRLTASGRQCLATWAGTLEQYRKAVGQLLRAVRKAAGITGAGKGTAS